MIATFRSFVFMGICIAVIVANAKAIAGGQASAPRPRDACTLVDRDQVSKMVGAPVSGGDRSFFDDKRNASTCTYFRGPPGLTITVNICSYTSDAAARKDFDYWFRMMTKLSPDTTKRDDSLGEGGYVTRDKIGRAQITAIAAYMILGIGVAGEHVAVTDDRLHDLMQEALTRR
jgi:hypothetical protein